MLKMLIYGKKVDVIPKELVIAKDKLWFLINSVSGIIVTDLDNKVLFANNSAKKLFGEDIKKFPYSINYGENTKICVSLDSGTSCHIEMRTDITTWNDESAYLVLLNRASDDDCSQCKNNCHGMKKVFFE